MENPLFRKKSMERVSSPEQLNDYIRVTSPGVWVVLTAVLVLLAGFLVWGIVGKLETKVNAVAVSEEGKVVCYVREEDARGIEAGNGRLSDYAMRLGGLSAGEWVYAVTLDAELSEGVYQASIVTGSVSPISFLFG